MELTPLHWLIEIFLFVILLVSALLALNVRDLLAAAVMLIIFSFMSAALMISMGAVDVGFTEAVVGAGVVGVFNILAIFATSRESRD